MTVSKSSLLTTNRLGSMCHFAASICDRSAVVESIPAIVCCTGSLPVSKSAELVSTSISFCISICDSERMESDEPAASAPSEASFRSATALAPFELKSSHSC